MPVSFSVKNVPDRVAKALRARARRNHRSLQGELLALLESASLSDGHAGLSVRETNEPWGPAPVAARTDQSGHQLSVPVPHPVPRQPRRSPTSGAFSIDRRKLAALCRRHHIRRLSVFGSALRPDFGPDSDVDFLVEFDERRPVGLRIFDVEEDLATLLGGRKPDLVNPKFLNARLRDGILASARVLYAEG